MISSKQLAILAPVSGQGGWLSEDHSQVTLFSPETLRGTKQNSGTFVARNPIVSVHSFISPSEAQSELKRVNEDAIALDLFLMLMDRDISRSTKLEIAQELESVFTNERRLKHVESILFAAPLPSDADTSLFLGEMPDGRVRRLAATLLECQPRIRSLQKAWIGMREDLMVKATDFSILTGVLIAASVFQRLALEALTQADLERLRSEILFERKVTAYCDPRILHSFLNTWRTSLPSVATGNATSQRYLRKDSRAEDFEESEIQLLSNTSSDEKLERAKKEVDEISRLFGEGKDSLAEQYLQALVDRQTSGVADLSHAVKSLSNIARRCSTAGRTDASLRCLTLAASLPGGLDTKLFLQIGAEFRRIGEYEKALECFNRAYGVDDGFRRDWIQREIIKVSVAKGDYAEALSQYKNLDNLEYSPETQTEMATIYRKSGLLRQAREHYLNSLSICGGINHFAEIGIAECYKQGGHLHRAISKYNLVFRGYSQIDVQSKKIYELGRAHLFQMTGQLEKAIASLNSLLEAFSQDPSIHFQLAKNYFLTGDFKKADHHFKRARGPDLSDIATALYELAVQSTQYPGSRAAGLKNLRVLDFLPQDRGLVSCRLAIDAIQHDDFPKALSVLGEAQYVDKLHQDFGAVLKFHAQKKLDKGFDRRSEQTLGRIAKRGYLPLKDSVNAISQGRFDIAIRNELRMCLLVA